MPDPESTTPRERNLLEAAFYGSAVLALLIAGTLAAVLVLLWACGIPPPLDPLLCLAGLLAGAGALRFYAHLAHTAP